MKKNIKRFFDKLAIIVNGMERIFDVLFGKLIQLFTRKSNRITKATTADSNDPSKKWLKPCKACSHQIAKDAKICPNCGHDARSWWGRRRIITKIVIILFALYGLGIILGESEQPATTSQPKTTFSQAEERIRQETNPPTTTSPTTLTITPEEYIKKVANCKECYVKVNYDPANKVFNSVEVHFNGSAGLFSPGSYTPKSDTFDILRNIYTRSNYPVNVVTVYVYLEFINPDGTTYHDRAMRTRLTKAKADKIDWKALSSNIENLPRYVDSFWMHRSLYVYG
jgi:hypothetical protein